ncbi:hypothetical protein LZD49_33645 [Dyadobacter sp. CY261]|uniref:hypothetical protein n=1 Tax=Dyadobacter sp. CY261 TaxID=2907203 RepID=UPI001F4169AA|nr:hypothetical protein [Dyadobacter sp. CY261]MCF0075472.1 hypothetical protein [Dyadobacter sp. CY261]
MTTPTDAQALQDLKKDYCNCANCNGWNAAIDHLYSTNRLAMPVTDTDRAQCLRDMPQIVGTPDTGAYKRSLEKLLRWYDHYFKTIRACLSAPQRQDIPHVAENATTDDLWICERKIGGTTSTTQYYYHTPIRPYVERQDNAEMLATALEHVVKSIKGGGWEIRSPTVYGGGDPEFGYEMWPEHDEWLHHADKALTEYEQSKQQEK